MSSSCRSANLNSVTENLLILDVADAIDVECLYRTVDTDVKG